ncbi:hypothetical protein FHG87_015471 [Trinorchestia longiramus]|nr:hypothetical protein FHG87_015471 [Trinorchestia longiramus]
MDGLLSVCHFCEQHGPSVVFCTQAHPQLPSAEQGCLVTESSGVCYVSSRVPLSAGVASLLHRACVRSLSCEASHYSIGPVFAPSVVCPGGEGSVYFGDDVRGHTLSYIFNLRDMQARGLKRWFSLVVLVKERAYLLSAWTFLVQHLQQVVQQLQERALQVRGSAGMWVCRCVDLQVGGFTGVWVCRCVGLNQWFLTWVRSNPRGSVSQRQGFGGGQDTDPTHMIRDDTPCLALIGCRSRYIVWPICAAGNLVHSVVDL